MSTVELSDGQTIGIAGLVNENMRTAVEQVSRPRRHSDPRSLFRSQSFQKGETELVILVTPKLAKPIKPADIKLPTDAIVEPSSAEFFLEGASKVARRRKPTAAASATPPARTASERRKRSQQRNRLMKQFICSSTRLHVTLASRMRRYAALPTPTTASRCSRWCRRRRTIPNAASNPPELAPEIAATARALKNALDEYRKDVAKGSSDVKQPDHVRSRQKNSDRIADMRDSAGLPCSHMSATQRGAVVVIVAVAIAALILMAGLALDMGHVFLNKTRLQNTVDAAALAAAKVLDQTGNTALATAEAMQAFGDNAAAAGNRELGDAYASGDGDIQVTVEYSATLPPFTPGALDGSLRSSAERQAS